MALQAASGQWPDPSPGTNSPLDCLCPGSAAAPDPLSWRAGPQRQAARAGGAARATRPGRATCPVRGELCSSQPGAAELGSRSGGPAPRGRGDRLRPGFVGPRHGGLITQENPEATPTNDALQCCSRHSTGRSPAQGAPADGWLDSMLSGSRCPAVAALQRALGLAPRRRATSSTAPASSSAQLPGSGTAAVTSPSCTAQA